MNKLFGSSKKKEEPKKEDVPSLNDTSAKV